MIENNFNILYFNVEGQTKLCVSSSGILKKKNFITFNSILAMLYFLFDVIEFYLPNSCSLFSIKCSQKHIQWVARVPSAYTHLIGSFRYIFFTLSIPSRYFLWLCCLSFPTILSSSHLIGYSHIELCFASSVWPTILRKWNEEDRES